MNTLSLIIALVAFTGFAVAGLIIIPMVSARYFHDGPSEHGCTCKRCASQPRVTYAFHGTPEEARVEVARMIIAYRVSQNPLWTGPDADYVG